MEAAVSAAAEAANTSESKLIKIKVKTLGQASYDLEVESDALIKDVKAQLAQASNISANHQRLVFRGRVLKDNQRLSNYDVVDASVVHMVTRPVDTSQQPAQPNRERMPTGGAGQFTANMIGAQGMGVPMDMNDFGSFIASMLHTMGIQGAVHVTHTTVPSDTTGNASPEQVAQAVAEQISQQARQQFAEAGGEAPVPLLSALHNYMQRLNAMYQGDASARFLNLPPGPTGSAAVFNVHQFAAAAREVIGDWEGADDVRDFIASSAEPSFAHWQPGEDPYAETQTPTAATAAQGGTSEAGGTDGQSPSAAEPTPASTSADAAAQAAEERDPRRNGMDNPFGDGRPEPMHPSLARLTEIAMHQLLRETARHLQAQAIPRIIQNRVHFQGQQHRLFSDEELQGLAQALHAEGTLLLETARAVSAYLLAQRNNSAAPLLNATAYHLRADGSAPANTVPAALSNRRLTQDRRNAIFLNGQPTAGGAAAGAGQAAGVGGRPPRAATSVRRGGWAGLNGGRGNASAGRGASSAQVPFVMTGVPMGFPVQALQAAMQNGVQFPVGGHTIRVNAPANDQETLSVQIDDGEPVTMNLEPLGQALESVFASVPGLEQLLGPLRPASATPTPAASQGGGAAQGSSGAPAAAGSTAGGGSTADTAAAPAVPAQQGSPQSPPAMLAGIMQQALPIIASMMAASGQANAPGSATPAAQHPPNAQRGPQDGADFGDAAPPFIIGPGNEVMVDIQALLQGGNTAAHEALGPMLEGIMFSMNQAGFPMHRGAARGGQAAGRAQAGRNAPRTQHARAQDSRRRPGEYPLAESDAEDEDSDIDDGDVPGLMRDSDQDLSLDGDSHGRGISDATSEEYKDDDEGDDDYEDVSADEADDDDGGDSDVPGLVDDEDSSEVGDRSEGWQTAEEDSEDEAEKRGGSDHGRRVRSRKDSPSPKKDATAAKDDSQDKVPKGQAGKAGLAACQEKQEVPRATAASSAPPPASSSLPVPVPTPSTTHGPQSWPLSAENFDDSVSPAGSPNPSAPVGLPPLPPQGNHLPVLGTGLALPVRGARGGRGNRRGGPASSAGRGSAQATSGPQTSLTPPATSVPLDSSQPAVIEVIPRQAGSSTGGPPNVENLLRDILGGAGGCGTSSGDAPRSSRGPGRAALMDILQSPALQQMTEQMFGTPPAAPVSSPPVSGAPSAAPSGPGGLMGVVSQLANTPAVQQMAEQLVDQTAEGSGQRAPSRGGGGGAGNRPAPDFGSFMQQMLPMMGQMLGGQAPPGCGPRRSAGRHAVDSGDDFAALNALPPAEASRWRQTILVDRAAQAEQPATPLSSTYLAGSRSSRSAE